VIGGDLGGCRAFLDAARSTMRSAALRPEGLDLVPAVLGDRAELLGAIDIALDAPSERPVSTSQHLRAWNAQTLVDALRHHGGMTRSQLTRATRLSGTTVASILDDLARRGLISEDGIAGSATGQTRGRPAACIRLHRNAGLVLGIEVGRQDVHAVLTDLGHDVLEHRQAAFLLDTPADEVLDLTAELVEAVVDGGDLRSQLIGVGVALPSPIDPADGRVDPHILATWAGAPAADRFAARFGAPVLVENDANAEAMAELSRGAGRGLRHMIYVKVSWGIGGAIVVDGRLRRGSRHAAGELAHLQIRGAHRPCRCGRPACLGPAADGNALRDDLRAVHGRDLALEEIVRLASTGDLVARRALDDSGRMIGQALAPLCNALNPEAIIVGGELGVAGSPLLDGIETGLSRATLPPVSEALQLRPAALGTAAGAIGAAGLVVRSEFAASHLAELTGRSARPARRRGTEPTRTP
jgi:predicted NBD/HSP70 family sugar kinase